MLVRLIAVGKRHSFRGPWALHDASIELRAGRVVEFAGPDGAGKSTLLSLLAGSTEPSTGRIEAPHSGAEYVPEEVPSGLFVSGKTYLRNMAAAGGLTRDAAIARVDELAAGLGLTAALELPLSSLPTPMGHRLALSRALAYPGRVIVLDDPWTGLDPLARDFLGVELTARRDAGACVVVTDEGPRPTSFVADERYQLADGALTPLGAQA